MTVKKLVVFLVKFWLSLIYLMASRPSFPPPFAPSVASSSATSPGIMPRLSSNLKTEHIEAKGVNTGMVIYPILA